MLAVPCCTARPALPGRHAPLQATRQRSLPAAQPRQPDAAGCSSRHGTCQCLATPFSGRPSPVGVHLHAGAVQGHHLQSDLQYPLLLQGGKHPIQRPVFGPAVHPSIGGMPFAEAWGQSPPLATVLRHVDNGVSACKLGMLTLPRCTGRCGAMRSYCSGLISTASQHTSSTLSVNRP